MLSPNAEPLSGYTTFQRRAPPAFFVPLPQETALTARSTGED
jgi:hypothetical protein